MSLILTQEKAKKIRTIIQSKNLDRSEQDLINELVFEALKRDLYNDYSDKPAKFINNELKIFNPERDPAIIPFRLWDFQWDYIENKLYGAYKKQDVLLNEKTRQMGFSWLYMAFYLWGILFDPAFTGFIMSYKEDLVDDGGHRSTHNSLMGKIRFMLDQIDNELIDKSVVLLKYLRIRNTQTEAFIIGESTQSEAGRGGTYKIALWDETARTPKSEDIWASFQQASRSIHLNSTCQGKGNLFARLRWDVLDESQIVTSHWSEHPEKSTGKYTDEQGVLTSPWREVQKKILRPTQLAQEVDINYDISAEGRVFNKLDMKVHVTHLEWPEPSQDSPHGLPPQTIISWDLGVADETFANVMHMDYERSIGCYDCYYNTDQEIRFYIDLLQGFEPADLDTLSKEEQDRAMAFAERARKRNYRYMLNILPPDALQRGMQSKASVRYQMQQANQFSMGRKRYVPMATRVVGTKILERIEIAKMVMDPTRNHFYMHDELKGLHERLFNYVWTKTAEGANKQIPKHDWACLAGQTKIRTLNDWVSIKDIKSGDYVWGYSHKEKRLIPTQVEWAGPTRPKAFLLEIGLDNGKSIKATPDHQFLLRDGTYLRADKLRINQSLMPFYEVLNRKYVEIDLNDGSFADEHRYVYCRFNNNEIIDDLHVDHLDGNRFNNHPSNLQTIKLDDHCQKTFSGKNYEERKTIDKTPIDRDFYNRKYRFLICKNCGKEYWGIYKSVYCSKICNNKNRWKRDKDGLINSRRKEYKNRMQRLWYSKLDKHKKRYDENGKWKRCIYCNEVFKGDEFTKYCSYICKTKFVSQKRKIANHRIRYIKKCANEDTYDLTVPETNNFVAEGVVVHNSHAADSTCVGIAWFMKRHRLIGKKPRGA